MFWRVLLTCIGIFCLFVNLYWSSYANAYTATVHYTEPADVALLTVVLVTEISGDYSQSYGQRSDAGSKSVKIDNIKPNTQYYFQAYRVDPITWERSGMSLEFPYKTSAYAEQTVINLPPLPMGNIQINIDLIQED